MPDIEVHAAASVGFERAAEAYERGRPSFPDEAISHVSASLDLGPAVRLLELGPGTGKCTRLLTPTGAVVIGVEPVDAMRRTLAALVPSCRVVGGVAEALPFVDGAFGGAVAAQVFHWLDGGRAVPELARVLAKGSRVALLWNVRHEDHAWVRELSGVFEPFRGDTPAHRTRSWRRAFDASSAFDPLELTSFPYEHLTTRDGVVDRISSISFIAALDAATHATVVEAVRDILTREGASRGDDAVRFPYVTEVWIAERR